MLVRRKSLKSWALAVSMALVTGGGALFEGTVPAMAATSCGQLGNYHDGIKRRDGTDLYGVQANIQSFFPPLCTTSGVTGASSSWVMLADGASTSNDQSYSQIGLLRGGDDVGCSPGCQQYFWQWRRHNCPPICDFFETWQWTDGGLPARDGTAYGFRATFGGDNKIHLYYTHNSGNTTWYIPPPNPFTGSGSTTPWQPFVNGWGWSQLQASGEVARQGDDIMGTPSNWQDFLSAKGQTSQGGSWVNTNWTSTTKYVLFRYCCWMHNDLASDTNLKIGTNNVGHTC